MPIDLWNYNYKIIKVRLPEIYLDSANECPDLAIDLTY